MMKSKNEIMIYREVKPVRSPKEVESVPSSWYWIKTLFTIKIKNEISLLLILEHFNWNQKVKIQFGYSLRRCGVTSHSSLPT